jgi:hypothetical protein
MKVANAKILTFRLGSTHKLLENSYLVLKMKSKNFIVVFYK